MVKWLRPTHGPVSGDEKASQHECKVPPSTRRLNKSKIKFVFQNLAQQRGVDATEKNLNLKKRKIALESS